MVRVKTLLITAMITGLPVFAQEKAAKAISAEFPFESHYVEVAGSKIHYIDEGEGDPIVFLHGNPTSSYLWRNIIPYMTGLGRCIAPDLIGMGKSDKPDIDYSFFDHVKYIDGFIEELGLKNITFVIHDWGSGIGFHYLARHGGNVKAVAYMEAILQTIPSYEAMGSAGTLFKNMRTPDVGWDLVVKQNIFIEQILPGAVQRKLSEEEMNHYREPYLEEASRKPVWKWPNELPIGGEPAEVVKAIDAYRDSLMKSHIPKLLFHTSSGGDRIQWHKDNLMHLETVDIGPGGHYVQEENPHKIGEELARWYKEL